MNRIKGENYCPEEKEFMCEYLDLFYLKQEMTIDNAEEV